MPDARQGSYPTGDKSPPSGAPGFCDAGSGFRLAPVTPILRFGDGLHFGSVGDDHVMREVTASFNPLDVAGDVRCMAHSDISRRHWRIHPDARLAAVSFPANILDHVVPDANLASANVLG